MWHLVIVRHLVQHPSCRNRCCSLLQINTRLTRCIIFFFCTAVHRHWRAEIPPRNQQFLSTRFDYLILACALWPRFGAAAVLCRGDWLRSNLEQRQSRNWYNYRATMLLQPQLHFPISLCTRKLREKMIGKGLYVAWGDSTAGRNPPLTESVETTAASCN